MLKWRPIKLQGKRTLSTAIMVFFHAKGPPPTSLPPPTHAATNLTSLESFDRCLAYPLTRLKAAQTSGWLLPYDDPELSHCLGNCFRNGGKKALARPKREDAAGGLLTEQRALEGREWNVGGLAEKVSEPCSLALG